MLKLKVTHMRCNIKNLALTLSLFILLIAISFSGVGLTKAQSGGSIIYSMPISITNINGATATPFQQMVEINSANYANFEAPNLQNIAFFDQAGNPIASWLESGNSKDATSTIYWLKLPNGIPAGTTITVNMGFADVAANLFDGVTVGEAPQLSSTYGQYDNGANVFDAYWNFAGTSFPNGWTVTINTPGHLTVNNGVTFKGEGTADGGTSMKTNTQYNTQTHVMDAYVQSNYVGTGLGAYAFGFENTQASIKDGAYALWTGPWSYEMLAPTMPLNTNWNVLSSWASSTDGYAAVNYGDAMTGANINFVPSTATNLNFAATGVDTQLTHLQWARLRAYPQDNIMPAVIINQQPQPTSLAGASGNPPTNLPVTGTPNNTILYIVIIIVVAVITGVLVLLTLRSKKGKRRAAPPPPPPPPPT